jgi:hypothetical protein
MKKRPDAIDAVCVLVMATIFAAAFISQRGLSDDKTDLGADGKLYPEVPLAKIAEKDGWVRPRAEITGKVSYVSHEADGDWHFRVEDPKDSKVFVVCEIIPELPMDHPKVGQSVTVRGVVRWDGEHKWGELHPVTKWEKR